MFVIGFDVKCLRTLVSFLFGDVCIFSSILCGVVGRMSSARPLGSRPDHHFDWAVRRGQRSVPRG